MVHAHCACNMLMRKPSQISRPGIRKGQGCWVLCDLDTFPGLMVFLSTFCPFETCHREDEGEKEGARGCARSTSWGVAPQTQTQGRSLGERKEKRATLVVSTCVGGNQRHCTRVPTSLLNLEIQMQQHVPWRAAIGKSTCNSLSASTQHQLSGAPSRF